MQTIPMPEPTINFTGLSINEANIIFAALDQSELPHKTVTALTNKLVRQCDEQLNPKPMAPGAEGATKAPDQPPGQNGGTEDMAPGLSAPE